MREFTKEDREKAKQKRAENRLTIPLFDDYTLERDHVPCWWIKKSGYDLQGYFPTIEGALNFFQRHVTEVGGELPDLDQFLLEFCNKRASFNRQFREMVRDYKSKVIVKD